jgi:hypothetical protein
MHKVSVYLLGPMGAFEQKVTVSAVFYKLPHGFA